MSDGAGDMANFNITLVAAPGQQGNQPGDPGSNPIHDRPKRIRSTPTHQTGVCSLNIREGPLSSTLTQEVKLNITDGGGNLLFSHSYEEVKSVVVDSTNSSLPYPVFVDFSTASQDLKRRSLFDPLQFVVASSEGRPVDFIAGPTHWRSTDVDSSRLPYCRVKDEGKRGFRQWLRGLFSNNRVEAPVSTLEYAPETYAPYKANTLII